MKPRDVKSWISKAVEHPLDVPPVLLEGPPGIGKSAIPRQVAEENNINFVDIRLAQRDVTDLRGIPAVIDGKARWLAPPELPTEGRGILMLDEITSCPPLTQASAYQLTLDRRISEYELPDGYYIVAAGNRLEDRAVVYRMSTALMNRFHHINFEVSQDDWVDWALASGIDSNVIGFISWRPELLNPGFDPESSEKAFATPRTWEFTSDILKVAPKGLMPELLEGTVGRGATSEFLSFLKVQTELPDLNTIFKGDNYVPKRTDLKYALVSALASHAKGVKQCDRLVQYSEHLPEEFGVLLVAMLVNKDEETMYLVPSFDKWVHKHSDVIITKKMI